MKIWRKKQQGDMGQYLEETDTSIVDFFEFWVGEDAVILQEFHYWKAHLNSEDRH